MGRDREHMTETYKTETEMNDTSANTNGTMKVIPGKWTAFKINNSEEIWLKFDKSYKVMFIKNGMKIYGNAIILEAGIKICILEIRYYRSTLNNVLHTLLT